MIKDLKELVAFGLTAGELVSCLADGVGFEDVAKLIETAKLAGPAFDNAAGALLQYVNMTDAEAAELEKFVETEFDISNDAVETAIELGLKVCIQLHSLVRIFVKP